MATKTPKTTKSAKGGTPAPAKRKVTATQDKFLRSAAKLASKLVAPGKLAAPQAKRKPGRPTKYTPETAGLLCQRLMEGKSLRDVCDLPDMPGLSTVCRWLHDGIGTFREQYARARVVQAEIYGEDTLKIADTPTRTAIVEWIDPKGKKRSAPVLVAMDAAEVSHRKLQVNTRQWYAGKMAPKVFGERLQVDPAEGASLVVFKDLTGRKDA